MALTRPGPTHRPLAQAPDLHHSGGLTHDPTPGSYSGEVHLEQCSALRIEDHIYACATCRRADQFAHVGGSGDHPVVAGLPRSLDTGRAADCPDQQPGAPPTRELGHRLPNSTRCAMDQDTFTGSDAPDLSDQ